MMGIALTAVVAKKAFTTDNVSVDVVMSIQSVAIEMDKVILPVASNPLTKKLISGRCVVKNTGNVNEDFSLTIASRTAVGSSTWSVVTTTPGANEFQLRAIFAEYKAVPTLTIPMFEETNDSLSTGSYVAASGSNYWCETCPSGDVGFSSNSAGNNVGVSGLADNQRHLYFRFYPGTQTTGTTTAWVSVLATATP
jgi:hypothetical protein